MMMPAQQASAFSRRARIAAYVEDRPLSEHNPQPSVVTESSSEAPASITDLESLRSIVTAVAGRFSSHQSRTTAAFALMSLSGVVVVQLPVSGLADALNEIGTKTVAAGLHDVQFTLQSRTSKSSDGLQEGWGMVLELDRQSADPLTEVADAGLPLPTCYFFTQHGFRLVWAFGEPVALPVLEELAPRAGLALAGTDPRSWALSQMQRLPTCLKTKDGIVTTVQFQATQTNSLPAQPSTDAFPFPHRVLRALGSGSCSATERERIYNHLDELGMPVPAPGEHARYSRCPTHEAHSSACCYVNADSHGVVTVHCLAGHDGAGPLHWNEQQLATLAGAVETSETIAAFDPLRDLPITHAGLGFIRHQLRDWSPVERDAAISMLMQEAARRDVRGKAPPDIALSVYHIRLSGFGGMGSVSVYYDRLRRGLAFDGNEDRSFLLSGDKSFNVRSHAHEAMSTAAYSVTFKETDEGLVVAAGWVPEVHSLLNKVSVGYGDALRVAGVADVTQHVFPIAHVHENWEIVPGSRHVRATLVTDKLDAVAEIDALDFFLDLWRRGELPLATENDVRLFLCALASPLLRGVIGQLGIYWFVGPPGAGKDYLADVLRAAWQEVGPSGGQASFDFNLAGELEMKRTFAMAGDRVYARAKEAGKRTGMVDMLISIAGTDMVSARGICKDDSAIPNSYTIVADSAEDLPDRREISRRTAMINVAYMDDKVSKGQTLKKVRAAAPGLIKNLKSLIEAHPVEWFLQQVDTGSRPLVPVALSRLVGATLPRVEGEDLSDLFEAMHFFVELPAGKQDGQTQLETARKRRTKESRDSLTFPSYRFSFFVDTLRGTPGYRELMERFGNRAKPMVNRIMRESEYSLVRSGVRSYLPVEIGGTNFAFRIEAGGRRFILVPEAKFLAERAAPAAAPAGSEPQASPPNVAVSPTSTPDAPTFSFSNQELLS